MNVDKIRRIEKQVPEDDKNVVIVYRDDEDGLHEQDSAGNLVRTFADTDELYAAHPDADEVLIVDFV